MINLIPYRDKPCIYTVKPHKNKPQVGFHIVINYKGINHIKINHIGK